MKRLDVLYETPIGRALAAYFFDLPRWTLFNIIFAIALAPSLFAGLRGEFALALLLSFPPALVMAGLIRQFSSTVEKQVPHWSSLWTNIGSYKVVLSAWGASVVVGLLLLTPLVYVVAVPALIIVLLVPVAVCGTDWLGANIRLVWRNAFIVVVHYPVISLGLVLLAVLGAWGVALSRGALIIALPALWAAISVYSVDDLIRSLHSGGKAE